MSYEYRPERKIPSSALSQERLAKYGIEVRFSSDNAIALICGDQYLCARREGDSVHLEHKGEIPIQIIDAIMTEFDTKIWSEDDPQFWGYGSHEEMRAACQEVIGHGSEMREVDIISISGSEEFFMFVELETAKEMLSVLRANVCAVLDKSKKESELATIDRLMEFLSKLKKQEAMAGFIVAKIGFIAAKASAATFSVEP
jgi:hypothetical protein